MSTSIARTLRKNMTRYEVKLRLRLRELRALGLRFRRQAMIGAFIVDFACFQSHVVVELDGGQHGEEVLRAKDAERDGFLVAQGFAVLRFWNHEVWENIEGVVETILNSALPRLEMKVATP
jgi:very-short-patch-repair endonuclease